MPFFYTILFHFQTNYRKFGFQQNKEKDLTFEMVHNLILYIS